MKWLEKFLARRGFWKMPEGVAAPEGMLLGFSNLGSPRKQLEAYTNHVYKCVTVIQRRASDVPFKLYKTRAGEKEEVRDHIFLDLMRRPNPLMSGRDLKAITVMHRDLTGMAFWLKVLNRAGRPVELWPLPVGNFLRFVFNRDRTGLVGYEFSSDDGGPKVFPAEEVVYFRYPHPQHLFWGASPIQAMAYAYDTDLAIRTYQRNFFQNSARADVVLQTDQRIEEADAKRLLLAWKQRHQGVSKAFQPALLDQGLKAQVLSVSARDFEFAALAGWTKDDILEAYNVPAGKLGSVKDVNKANALGIDITFNSECISPRLASFDDTVTLSILPHYDTGLSIEHVDCIPRDLEHDLKERESNLGSGFTTINEEREKEGMEPVAWGDKPFLPLNLVQVGDEPAVVREAAKPVAEKSSRHRQNTQALHERKVATRSRAFRAWLRKFFRAQEKEVLAALRQHYPRINGVLSGMGTPKAKLWLAANKDLTDRISFDMAAANEKLAEGTEPYLQGALQAAGEDALAFVGVDRAFDLFSEHAANHLREKLLAIKDVNDTTKKAIRKQVTEGFEAGESMESIAKRINGVFDNADKVRSLRIAQTEVNGSANFGTLEGYRQSGVVRAKEWLAGPDARESHVIAEATYTGDGAIPLDQDFSVGAGAGPCPGSIGLAEEDINCRCTMIPVVREQ